MDLALGMAVFLLSVAACMVLGQQLAWALAIGFAAFFLVGLHRGFSPKALLAMAARGAVTSLTVLRIMVLIGLLTALWRAGGSIAFFVHAGVRLMTPNTFILAAFLLPGLLCLAFGSCFGVAGTAGVILMAIAKGGGANLVVTAGAVLSGCYVGERLSPASSAAALAAAVSGSDQREMQRRLWKNTVLPLALSVAVYLGLSFAFPIRAVDQSVLAALETEFRLTWPAVLPALALLLLPWLKVSAFWSIAVSCVLAALSALFLQGIPLPELLRACVWGYTAHLPALKNILSGGGLLSMVPTILVVLLSCSSSGLFNGTGMLEPWKAKAGALADRVGLFPAMCLISLCCASLFCNQAVTIVMTAGIMERRYREEGKSPLELGTDLCDSGLNLAGIIPWCIACSVPLATIGGGPAAVPFAVYLYLVPLCRLLRRKR